MTSHRLLVGTCLAGVMLLAESVAPACADSMNYGALEQLFGEPVTTSVTGSPQRVSDAPANVEIITQADIQRSGADNIPDILQFQTGIETRRYTFGQSEVAIRGFDQALNSRVLVLINGRQAYLDDYGYVSWDSLPVQLDEIRQIEIVKGPNSALFGFNAASGVINIITVDPVYDRTDVATVRAGTQSLRKGDVVATLPVGRTAGVRISLGGFRSADFETPPDLDSQRPSVGTASLSAGWHVTPRVDLTSELGWSDSRFLNFLPNGDSAMLQHRTNDERIGGSTDTVIGLLSIDAYRNEAQDRYSFVLGNNDFDNVVYVARANDLAKIANNVTIRLGVEYRNNSTTSAALSNVLSYDDYAANVMGNWAGSGPFSAMAAVRLDKVVLHHEGPVLDTPGRSNQIYNNTTLTAPTFNLGLVYMATAHDTGRLSFARGLEMPSLIDFGLQSVVAGRYAVVGSPELQPTAVWNAEIDWDHVMTTIPATVTGALFFQRNDNLLAGPTTGTTTSTPEFPAIISSANVGSANALGLELGVKGVSTGGFRWNASYRFMSITDDITADVVLNTVTDPRHGTPDHAVVLGGGYSIGRWSFDGGGRWQSRFRDYRIEGTGLAPVDIANYVTLNARVGYRINRILTVSGWAEQFNVSHLQATAGGAIGRRFVASITARL